MSDPIASEPTEPAPLLTLRGGLPPVVDARRALSRTIDAVGAGSGPVAIDAERASGYRYSARAYLVQIRREGTGTALIDPVAFDDLEELGDMLASSEWVVHAANQDLPCLAELGMRPTRLFDTELAGRLLGYPRVGLASMVEELLGYRMRKEHAAVDWSTRPLPEDWLLYAALDVEVLIELQDEIRRQLADTGKLGWAEEEFAALVNAKPVQPRPDPWRRTSGIHRVRGRRALAVVRELWHTRDAIAARKDVTPRRILSDAAIVEAALTMPKGKQALASAPGFRGRGVQRHLGQFADAIGTARSLPNSGLPLVTRTYDGPPPAKVWAEKNPSAADRLARCRDAVREVAEHHNLPVENLIAPDTVRRLCWSPPEPLTHGSVAATLRGLGAREWQLGLTGSVLTAALQS
ncbi:MAG: ribonuclease D [Propionibacteriales bacterium]|nr:ribonuclease D [Propionibacteriales bacterium]